MRVGYIWTGNERYSEHATYKPGRMHINMLPHVIECDVIECVNGTWNTADDYDLVIVQHFTQSHSVIAPIRDRFPRAKIAVRPDRPPEWEVRNRPQDLNWLLRDLSQADVILDAMPDGRRAQFWAQMVNKPWAVLPTPIVPHPEIELMRNREREELIVGWLHPSDPEHHLPTLATLAAIQREISIRVTVVNATGDDLNTARVIGLDAEFMPAPTHEGFLDLLSRARLAVDLFPMHTPARVATVAAWLGTPTITGLDTPNLDHVRVDTWCGYAHTWAIDTLNNPDSWNDLHQKGIVRTHNIHCPEAIQQYVEALI